jgi:branched-chain amino acid transport system substrate-binding protein
MKKRYLAVLLALVLPLAIVAAGCGGEDEEGAGTTEAATEPGEATSCSGQIAIMAPITGDAASIGAEQVNFMKFALQKFNEENGTDYQLQEFDTQLDPAQASTAAQRIVSNDEFLGVVGPAGSQEIEAVGPIFGRAGIAYISGSATRTDLTEGDKFPGFFRTVPHDDVQGPTDGNYIADQLNAEDVWVIDDQSSYSTGLADAAEQTLKDAGVKVQRESINQDQADFSALVSRVKDADVVFIPFQLANQGQVFGQQLAEQGSDAVLFGADGLLTEEFSIEGAYVSSFAPDIKALDESQDLVQEYEADFGEFTSPFGPPSFLATQVLLSGIQQACEAAGGTPSREDVVAAVQGVTIDDSILGGSFSFDENGDPEGATFYIFKVIGKGEYELQES